MGTRYRVLQDADTGARRLLLLDKGKQVASCLLSTGGALERLYVDPAQRGKGFARKLVRVALSYWARKHPGEPLSIKPRPFNDMSVGIPALRAFYVRMGFEPGKDGDVMLHKTASTGRYKGEPSDPDSVKFTKDFQGLTIEVDRPKGFVMSGKDPKGTPWTRTYQYDYGFIPGTLGGDDDGLDVYLGPDTDAKTAYWVVQLTPDGDFDEYKVFLGFADEADAIEAYKKHAPEELLGSVSAMSIEMMKAMLGESNPQESVEKMAHWDGFYRELLAISGMV